MGNLTVKKADGTTDTTYSMIAASAGDNSPALYRSTTTGGAAGRQATLEVSGRANNEKTLRRVTDKFTYPYNVVGTDGVERTVSKVIVETTVAAPLNVPQSIIDEAVAQSANLGKHADLQAARKSGYAPRT